MKDHSGMVRGFHWSNRAWYKNIVDKPEINFGMYDNDGGGTTGEMSIKWISLNNKLTPKLECFDDGWNALSLYGDLLQKMGEVDSEDITDKQFVQILLSCGFKDLTAYKNPYE